MSHFLEVALRNAARGFRVMPIKGKDAFLKGWPKLATTDEKQIREWAAKFPDYNCGVAGGVDITIVDSDRASRLKGLCGENWSEWFDTYSVSSGRPDRAHFYFRTIREVMEFGNKRHKEPGADGNVFEVKTKGAQVTAEGSTHPDTGEVYTVTQNLPLLAFPIGLLGLFRELYANANPSGKREWRLPVHDGEGRDDYFISQAGKLRNAGASEAIIRAQLEEWNEDPAIMADPKSNEDLDRIARSAARYDVPRPEPVVVIGRGKAEEKRITGWRERYHTFEEMNNAPEPTFIIAGFLQKDVISSIAAPVGQRKTIIAANVVHAALTGEPLFGHFAVVEQPVRVLYLCPEMGLLSFTKRMRNLGLMQYIGKTLFCRTMNSEGTLSLADLTPDELAGAVVVVDTAVRFLKGDENSSEYMKVFADECFGLMKSGAASVLVLFHSPKGTKEAGELTLENAMRGSGDLGAFVSSCWATRLQDPDAPWESPSFLKNVKQRDFESDPFEVKSDRLGRLHIVTKPGANVVLAAKKKGTVGNADGREDEALQIIRDNPTLSQPKIVLRLKEMGIERSRSWVGNKRFELLNAGVKTSA
jgi:hypothetical protein